MEDGKCNACRYLKSIFEWVDMSAKGFLRNENDGNGTTSVILQLSRLELWCMGWSTGVVVYISSPRNSLNSRRLQDPKTHIDEP